MRKSLHKLNNQGSTLLTVIICIAFIGILGSMMLSATMTNLQMKIVESKAKTNFYSCEKAMEEIRVGIQELTAKAIEKIYKEEVLPNYASYINMTEVDRNTEIQNMVAETLGQILSEDISVPGDIFNGTSFLTKVDLFNTYISMPLNPTNTVSDASVKATEASYSDLSGSIVFTPASVLIQEIKVTYAEGDYKTSITSDIRVTIPEFSFDQQVATVSSSMSQPFQDYVFVADGEIISNNASGTNEITGSVYSGNGITIKDNDILNTSHEVIFSGANMVTRGNIKVSDTAKLTVENTSQTPAIWANSLLTETSNTYNLSNSSSTTNINVKGICVIKDDLSLDGRNSAVDLSEAYVGYTGLHTSSGSAIMINGSGSSMNLGGLSSLILAGRAHVSIKDTNDSDILTGESIAFKSNQRAYLVPEEFITNVGHNPVTEADIAGISPDIPKVEIKDDLNIPYLNYVAGPPLNPFKIAAKQTIAVTATTLRYYYLNFGSGKQADEYLKVYSDKYSLNSMDPFTLGNVTLPISGTSNVVGNMMSYTGGAVQLTSGLSYDSLTYPDDSSLDTHISDITLDSNFGVLNGKKVNQLGNLYSRICHLLPLDGAVRAYDEAEQVVAYGIKTGAISDFVTNNHQTLSINDYTLFRNDGTFTYSGSPDKYMVVNNGDTTIGDSAELNGMLIASGNIKIDDNATINGMIVSAGDIEVGNSVTVNGRLVAAGSIKLNGTGCTFNNDETFIEPIFLNEGAILSNLFNNMEETSINFSITAPNLVDISLSNMITYENWSKN